MTKEQTFLLKVLSDHLNSKKTDATEGLDWQTVLDYAQKHQIEGILYYQCKDYIPAEFEERLSRLYAADLFYYSNRRSVNSRLEKSLENAGIPFFTAKGLDIAELYPVPALRTMGDCDIFVHSSDRSRANDLMLSLGFENCHRQDMEWIYYKNNMEFELHDHLLYDETVNSRISRDFTGLAWEYTTGDGPKKRLDRSFHFIFLLLHLKKHLLNTGVGFRQFADLVVVVQKCRSDWDAISKTLEQLKTLRFAEVCLTLCERWFGIEMPVKTELSDDFYACATEKIFANGVFGFDDRTNHENGNLNRLRRFGKLRTIIGRIFPPYKSVYHVPHYSFVQGRRWLLPVVWIYRPFRSLICGKGADGVKLISSAVNSDEKLAQREETLRQWGL